MFNTSKKTQELLTFLYQWQHKDPYHIYNLNSLYALEFIDELEKFDLLESYYDYDLSSYFKDEFIAFAVDGAGGYFCFWIYPELEGEPPIIHNDGHGKSKLLAASFHDFACRMVYEVNFDGDKELDEDIIWDLAEYYDEANSKDIDKDEANLLIAKDRKLFKNNIHNIASLLTEDDVKNNLMKTPSFIVKDAQFLVKSLELYILTGKEISCDEDLEKVLKHFEAEFTNGVELYDKEILLSGFKGNYPNYWKSKKVQNWINFIENLTEKDKKLLFLARIETYIKNLKDNDTKEAKLIKIRYEELYESLKKEIEKETKKEIKDMKKALKKLNK